ncbi:MAG: ribosome small subunit-dependent GTPase A [Opitutaceae bacterium]|jgi:ribosome biogenesis GTPase|nr:ribosome small subunit-dependent GTPase A [Opitutaceae bacterium]
MSRPLEHSRGGLPDFGWTPEWERAFAAFAGPGLEPGRVVSGLRRKFHAVRMADGEALGRCPGSFFRGAEEAAAFPAVGDWVAVRRRAGEARAEILAVLPRRSKFSRRAAGESGGEQVVAANVDVVFLVEGLDRGPDMARARRFVAATLAGGAAPVTLLNKADLRGDAGGALEAARAALPGVPVFLTSAVTGEGLEAARGFLGKGTTAALVGASGAGKSSLVNALLREEALPVAEVRAKDARGRHTTTRRELLALASGAALVDTPGLRELRLWEAGDAAERLFPEMSGLIARCRFANCSHGTEPGCAVRAAIEGGGLSRGRWEEYLRLGVAAVPARVAGRRGRPREEECGRNAWRARCRAAAQNP